VDAPAPAEAAPASVVPAGLPIASAARYAASSREKPETRIEIGHVEVRLTNPSRPARARATSRPRGMLVRPAGLFGLRQS
jgi:hypothetical protein